MPTSKGFVSPLLMCFWNFDRDVPIGCHWLTNHYIQSTQRGEKWHWEFKTRQWVHFEMNFEKHITCKLKPSFLQTAITVLLDYNESFGRIKYLKSINHLKNGIKSSGYWYLMGLLREWGTEIWFCEFSSQWDSFSQGSIRTLCELIVF